LSIEIPIAATSCPSCSFYSKETGNPVCYAGRLSKWTEKGLVRTDENGDSLVDGICNLYNTDPGSLEDILIKRKRDISIPVSFLVIYRGEDQKKLSDTVNSILVSDYEEKTELKIVAIDSDPYDFMAPILAGEISHSIVYRMDKEEDPNLILTNSMKKMKNAFVVVVEAGHLVYDNIREQVNNLINEELRTVSLLEQGDGNFYGCMLVLAKHLQYFAYGDLGEKLRHIVKEVTYV
jgi:hypothetical protein